MADLLELANIQDWSVAASDDPDPHVPAARDFRARVRLMLVKRVAAKYAALPPNPQEGQLEQLAFCQQVLRSPTIHLETVFNIILAGRPISETIDDILALNDATINTALADKDLSLLARFSRG